MNSEPNPNPSMSADKTAVQASPEQLAAELGPFNPPADYRFGPEFDPSPPRPIPAALSRGSYERKWRQRVTLALTLSLCCALAARIPWIQDLSYYILALGYLDWVGYGMAALVAIAVVLHYLRPVRFRFVREGIPVIARVLNIGLFSVKIGQNPMFGFAVLIEYRDPRTGKLAYRTVRSEPISTQRALPRYSMTIRPGDYVTAVGMPDRFEESLTLYGLLGLQPGLDAILKDGKPDRGMESWVALLIIAAVIGLLALLVTTLYIFAFLTPVDGLAPGLIGMAAGGAIALALTLAKRRASSRKSGEAVPAKPKGFLKAAFSFTILGMLAGFCATNLINAAFDFSPPEYQDIRVVQFWEETWYPLFIRNYQIEYASLKGDSKQKYPARHEEMEKFQLKLGVADFRAGALGMRWVRGLHPLVATPLDPKDPPESATMVSEEKHPDGTTRKAYYKAMIDLGGGKILDPGDDLIDSIGKFR